MHRPSRAHLSAAVDVQVRTVHEAGGVARHEEEHATGDARFGKGRHTAGLNFGDCLTYAVARRAAQPLLFVGKDFAKTDIAAA
jgi:ribonuclease VapC